MSKPKTAEEAKILSEKENSFTGKRDVHEYSVKEELPSGMRTPIDKEDAPSKMDGIHKGGPGNGSDSHMSNSGMTAARAHLERETERKTHMPKVGGYTAAQHSGHTAED